MFSIIELLACSSNLRRDEIESEDSFESIWWRPDFKSIFISDRPRIVLCFRSKLPFLHLPCDRLLRFLISKRENTLKSFILEMFPSW